MSDKVSRFFTNRLAQGMLLSFFATAGWFVVFVLWVRPPLHLQTDTIRLPSPNWDSARLQKECRPPDELEQQRNQLALQVLKTFRPNDTWSALRSATISQFVYGNPGRIGDRQKVCPPAYLDADVAQAAISAGIFNRNAALGPDSFLDREALDLAHRLGPIDPRIVDGVIRTAFYSRAIFQGGNYSRDVRTDALLALADFCRIVPIPYEQALQRMSFESQYGRAAARLATACGDQKALPIVSGWMQKLLERFGGTLIQSEFEVLEELAYALEIAGTKAQPYSGPILTLLDRKVRSWEPPFGMLVGPPTEMCSIARRIGGTVAEEAMTKSACWVEQ